MVRVPTGPDRISNPPTPDSKVYILLDIPRTVEQYERRRVALSSMLDVLAKKRTSMTMLKAGMVSTTVPFSFMLVLVPMGGIAFSSLSLSFLSLVSAGLMVLGTLFIYLSIRDLRECSRKKRALCDADSRLSALVQA